MTRQNGSFGVVEMMSGPARPFVVLHHVETGGGEHWDLMLDDGDALATWQLFAWPPGAKAGRACEIFRHRRRYLEYEGALSRGRGTVRRVESGEYQVLDRSVDRWVVLLHGATVSGEYVLQRVREQEWTFGPATPDMKE